MPVLGGTHTGRIGLLAALFLIPAKTTGRTPPVMCSDFDKTAITASPNTGQISPDVLVRIGSTVQLSGTAEHFRVCTVEHIPRPLPRPQPDDVEDVTEVITPLKNFHWRLAFRPPAGLPVSGPALNDATTLNPTFLAGTRGTYVVELTAGTSGYNRLAIEAVQSDDWVSIGPDGRSWPNWTGRVNSFAFDAVKKGNAYAASARGGVWRTDDGAANWYPLSDHKSIAGFSQPEWPKAMAVARLAMGSTGRLFAATGDAEFSPGGLDINIPRGYAFGLFVSDDGGATWSAPACNSGAASPATAISQVLANRQNGNVYVSSSNGLFRSTDSGACWEAITPPGAGRVDDIAISQVDGKTRLIASIQQGAGSTATIGQAVVATLDADAATPVWKPTLQGGTAIAALDPKKIGIGRIRLAAKDDVAYAAVPVNDVVTVFQGLPFFGDFIWIKQGNASDGCYGGQCAFYDLVVTINPENSQDVIVGGVSVNRSTNGGKTFTDLFPSHPDTHALAFDPWIPNLLWVGNDGGVEQIQLSPTGSIGSWLERNSGMATDLFLGFSISSSDPTGQQVAGGLQDNGTMTRISGRSWRYVDGGDGNGTAEDAKDPSIVYYQVSANSGPTIFRSPGGAAIGQANGMANDPRRPGVLLGTGVDADSSTFQLYQGSQASTGDKIQWTCADPTPQSLKDAVMAVLVLPDGSYMVGTQEGLLWKVDAASLQANAITCFQNDVILGVLVWFGAPKVAAGGPGIAQGQITGLALDPKDSSGQSFYATLGRYDQWRVVHFAYQAPKKPWWIATPIAANFPHANTPSCLDCFSSSGTFFGPIAVDPVETGRVYVGTDDGLYVGNQDNGGTWNWAADQSFPEVWVEGLGVTQKLPVTSNTVVRASTFGRAMWERVFPKAQFTAAAWWVRAYVLDRPFEWQRAPEAIVAVEYGAADHQVEIPVKRVSIEVQVLNHGEPLRNFLCKPVEVQGSGGSFPITVVYGGKETPLALDSDALRIVLRDYEGQVLVKEEVPMKLRWRRPDGRGLYLETVAHVQSGAPLRSTAVLRVANSGQVQTPDTLTFERGAEVIIEAPSQVETPLGPAEFVSWTNLKTNGRDLFSDSKAHKSPHLVFKLNEDSVVYANYRVSAKTEGGLGKYFEKRR